MPVYVGKSGFADEDGRKIPKTCENLDLLLPEYKFRYLRYVGIMYGITYRGNNDCE